MHGGFKSKAPRYWLARAAVLCVLLLLFSVFSVVSVMANTVSATVLDGGASYTFSMNSADLESILYQAQQKGLEPLGPLDVAERVENTTTVNVRRGVKLRVTEAGQTSEYIAYKGDTVRKALAENNILLKKSDAVTPGRDMVIEADLAVDVKRSCEVTVTVEGKSQVVSMTGGTVADALEQAKVKLGPKDACNYSLEEPLFDKMNLRVSRMVKVTVTADGKTGEYEIAAQRVQAALERCGIKLGKDDRLNVSRTDMVRDGMAIQVERVRVEEETVESDLDYTTYYEYDNTLYAGEEEVKTPGEKGQRKTTYQVTYVDGEMENRQVLSDVVTKEPVQEVIRTGTKQKANMAGSQGVSLPGAGTFVDYMGKTVSYSSKMVGECTAYSIPGGTTSIGLEAKYGIIAVNPSVIPYGTRMYVASPDGSVVYGYGVAADTGGALLDGTVIADLCYDTVEECSAIGRRDMVVYILS
ncbi:DUF348 domain-containing protein [bacterium D16-76]|nr:DUF348 domain-containing protein [bacterium D16-76]